jgi:putative endonuclease
MTSNLNRRYLEHVEGKYPNSFTFNRRPVEVVWSATFTSAQDAIRTERQLKKWTRKKKEALIEGNEELLVALAKKDFSEKR